VSILSKEPDEKTLSPSELLLPGNAIEVKWLEDIPEEIKQQALALGDTESTGMSIIPILSSSFSSRRACA
jgi:hypothetical protein